MAEVVTQDASPGTALTGERSHLDPLSSPFSRVRIDSLGVSIAIVAGVAAVLGLIRLGAPSFWVDEGYTAYATHRSPEWWVDNDQYHVLYDSVARFWSSVFGTSELALRLPSVFGAMAACALLVVLARKFLDPWTALLSGLFLATSPFLVKWSQQARGYTLFLAVSLGATLLLLRALDRGTRGAWAVYGLGFSAAVVWHAVAGLLLVPAHLVLIAQRRGRVLPHGGLAAVIICVVAVPWAATIAMRSTGAGVGMNWLTAPTPTTVAHAVLDISGASGLGLLLALVGLVVLAYSRRADLAVWLGVWAFAPFVLALLPSAVRPIFLDRFLIVAAPAFALLAATALTGIGRRLGALAAVAAVVATTIGLAAWYQAADAGNWRGEDWRSAVGMVLERRGEADAIVVAPWSARPAAAYYGAPVTDTSTADSIWVLAWSETSDDITVEDRRALGFGDHHLVEKQQFGSRVSAQLWSR
jgi:4-amino-4-deoxy-L-arabinose transferase-like glycosyltransferase